MGNGIIIHKDKLSSEVAIKLPPKSKSKVDPDIKQYPITSHNNRRSNSFEGSTSSFRSVEVDAIIGGKLYTISTEDYSTYGASTSRKSFSTYNTDFNSFVNNTYQDEATTTVTSSNSVEVIDGSRFPLASRNILILKMNIPSYYQPIQRQIKEKQLESLLTSNQRDFFRSFDSLLSSQRSQKNYLTAKDLMIIADNIKPLILLMKPNDISEIIWGLGTMNKNLKLRDQRFISLVIDCLSFIFDINYSIDSPIAFTKLLVGIARLEVKYSDIPSSILLSFLNNGIPINMMNSQGISNLFWSLGWMEVPMTEIQLDIRNLMIKKFCELSNSMTDQGISNCLIGLQKMGVLWSELPVFVKSAISTAICCTSPKMSSQSIGNILYSLGKMNAEYLGFTTRLQIAIDIGIRRACKNHNERDISQILHGLSLLGYTFNDNDNLIDATYLHSLNWMKLPKHFEMKFRNNIYDDTSRLAVCHGQDISVVISALCKLFESLDEMPAPIKATIFLGFQILSGQVEFTEQQSQNEKDLYGAYQRKSSKSTNSNINRNISYGNDVIINEMTKYFNTSKNLYDNNFTREIVNDEKDLSVMSFQTKFCYPIELVNSFAISLQALSKIHSNITSLPLNTQNSIWVSISFYSSSFSLLSLSKVLLSLVNFKMKWHNNNNISYEQQMALKSIQSAIYKKFESFLVNSSYDLSNNIRCYCNIIHSLGMMYISWDMLPLTIKSSITLFVTKSFHLINTIEQFKYLLNSLISLKVNKNSFNQIVQYDLIEAFVRLFDNRDNVISNDLIILPVFFKLLIQLQINFISLPSTQIRKICNIIIDNNEDFSEQVLSTLFFSIYELKLYKFIDQYWEIKNIFFVLFHKINKLIINNGIETQFILRIFHTINKSNLWNILPKGLLENIKIYIENIILSNPNELQLSSYDLMMLFHGLPSLYKNNIHHMSDVLRESLEDHLSYGLSYKSIETSELLAIISSMTDLNIKISVQSSLDSNNVYGKLLMYINNMIDKFSSYDIARIIAYLFSMKLLTDHTLKSKLWEKLLFDSESPENPSNIGEYIDTAFAINISSENDGNTIDNSIDDSDDKVCEIDDNVPVTKIPSIKRSIRVDENDFTNMQFQYSSDTKLVKKVSTISIVKLLDHTNMIFSDLSVNSQASLLNRLKLQLQILRNNIDIHEEINFLRRLVNIELYDITTQNNMLKVLVQKYIENLVSTSIKLQGNNNFNSIEILRILRKFNINLSNELKQSLVNDSFNISIDLKPNENLLLLHYLLYIVRLDSTIINYLNDKLIHNFFELIERSLSNLSVRSNHPSNFISKSMKKKSSYNYHKRLLTGYQVAYFFKRNIDSYTIDSNVIGIIDILLCIIQLQIPWKNVPSNLKSNILKKVVDYLVDLQLQGLEDSELHSVMKFLNDKIMKG